MAASYEPLFLDPDKGELLFDPASVAENIVRDAEAQQGIIDDSARPLPEEETWGVPEND